MLIMSFKPNTYKSYEFLGTTTRYPWGWML